MSRHTPGPWTIYGLESDFKLIRAHNGGVATILENWKGEETKANARLIAAAPAMYEALIDVAASLVAAISLLKAGGKKGAPSDTMFSIMLDDYQKSVDRARAILSQIDGE